MARNLDRFAPFNRPTDKVWWYAFWFLRAGRKTWEVVWLDPTLCEDQGSTPRATTERQYGPLDGFEQIAGVPPLHVREVMEGAHFQIKLPKRKRGQQSARLEPVIAVQ